jgi:hypothetical protein
MGYRTDSHLDCTVAAMVPASGLPAPNPIAPSAVGAAKPAAMTTLTAVPVTAM